MDGAIVDLLGGEDDGNGHRCNADCKFVSQSACKTKSRAISWMIGALVLVMALLVTIVIHATDVASDSMRQSQEAASSIANVQSEIVHIKQTSELQNKHVIEILGRIEKTNEENYLRLERLLNSKENSP